VRVAFGTVGVRRTTDGARFVTTGHGGEQGPEVAAENVGDHTMDRRAIAK
jgi:hypothetical protein